MRSKVLFSFVFFLSLVSGFPYKSEAWMINGKDEVDNGENVKEKEGLGTMLWLIKPNDFFEKWDTPETPKLEVTKEVKRNVPISAVVLFVNPGVNDEGKCDLVYDMIIRKPDGTVYADLKDLEGLQNKSASLKNSIQLAVQNVGIMIEDKDPLGKYTVDAVVKDKVKKVEVPLHNEFIAKE